MRRSCALHRSVTKNRLMCVGFHRTDALFKRCCPMDDATVLHACRLLHEVLCNDLELGRLTVSVERDSVLLTIHTKRGKRECKVIVGENSPTENVRQLDDWR
jgi:hypothetical protein